MIVRFFFGAVTGAALVASAMIAASGIFPLHGTRSSQPSETAEPADTDAEALGEDTTQEAASPEPAPEPEPEPEPADTAQTETVVATVENAEPEDLAEAETEALTVTVEENEPAVAAADPAITATQPDVTEATAVVPEASDNGQAAETPVVAEVTAPATPEAPAPLPAPVEDQAAAVETTETTIEAITEATPEVSPAPEPAPEPQPETAIAPETGSDAEALPEAVAEAQPETADGAEPDVADDPQPEVAAETPAPSDDEPKTGTEATVEGEETDSTFAATPGFASESAIIDQGEASVADAADALAEAGASDGTTVDLRPITAFAAAFQNPESKPVLAIVLIDGGAADLDRAALAALPFPVSFALDPMHPASSEQAAVYRAAGREVIILATGIAEGSQASDVEVAFQSMSQRLPEAVAVMDLAESVFQDNRPLASLVVPVIGAEGRGVLSWDKGLNAADQVARRDDIASAVIFRDLATGGGDAAAAKRTLDRAVFKAGQDGRVVVAGDITPVLVTALLEWSVEGRAGAVALAPLTAVLQVD